MAYTSATPFPGVAAALPVLGTVAVIAAGRTEGVGSLHPLIDTRAVQALGNWSYSLYLWHFPVTTYYVAVRGHHPGFLVGAVLLAVSVALAYLSYRFVENPVRTNAVLRDRRLVTAGAAACAMALTGAVAVTPQVASVQHTRAAADRVAALEAEAPAELGHGSFHGDSVDTWVPGHEGVVVPIPSEAREAEPVYPQCSNTPAAAKDTAVEECVVANPEGERTLVVVGDSHASQWVPMIADLVEGTDWRLVAFLKDSCPFTSAVRTYEQEGGLVCTDVNEETRDRIIEADPDVVLTSARWYSDFADDSDGAIRDGFEDMLQPVADAGAEVIALEDNPADHDATPAPSCVAGSEPDDVDECGFPRSEETTGYAEGDSSTGFREAAEAVDGARFESLTDTFCTDNRCPAVIGSVLVYRDENHLSLPYIATLREPLAEVLDLDGVEAREFTGN